VRHPRKLRIAYLSGPVDAAAVHVEWSEGRQLNYFGTVYMKQFFHVCTGLDSEGYVITTLRGEHSVCRKGSFVLENIPEPSRRNGVLYHLTIIQWFLRLVPKLLRFRPDILIVTAFQNYWFLLFFLRWYGVSIVPSVHCTLWPKFAAVRRSWRFLWQLNRLLVLRHVKAMLVVSNDIMSQLRALLGRTDVAILRHIPTYPRSQFEGIDSPTSLPRAPFRVFFAGRIETNKGIYDLLEMARRLNADREGGFYFDLCGEGQELDALRNQVETLNLQEVVSCHGYCNSEKLASLLGRSHVVIVPTTSRFEEGFNKVCAEAVLAGRPVITSAVCPALADIEEAAVEVQPDNIDQYCQAILDLCDDRAYYVRKHLACAGLQELFYNVENNWGSKFQEIVIKYVLKSDQYADAAS
jgi:glycogen synthase